MSSRGFALIAVALVLSAGLLGVQLASGGADFVPQRPADPCQDRGRTAHGRPRGPGGDGRPHRPRRGRLQAGRDPRTAPARAARPKQDRAELARETGTDERGLAQAIKDGLRTGVDRLEKAGQLPKAVGAPAVDRRPARHLARASSALIPDGAGRQPAPDRRRAAPVARQDRREHRPRGPRRPQVARVGPPRCTHPRRDRRGQGTDQGRTARPAPGAHRLIASRRRPSMASSTMRRQAAGSRWRRASRLMISLRSRRVASARTAPCSRARATSWSMRVALAPAGLADPGVGRGDRERLGRDVVGGVVAEDVVEHLECPPRLLLGQRGVEPGAWSAVAPRVRRRGPPSTGTGDRGSRPRRRPRARLSASARPGPARRTRARPRRARGRAWPRGRARPTSGRRACRPLGRNPCSAMVPHRWRNVHSASASTHQDRSPPTMPTPLSLHAADSMDAERGAGSASRRGLRPGLLAIGLVVSVISSLGAPLIPTIARDLHASLSATQWSLTATLLVGAVASPLVGRLGDGPHRRTVLSSASALVTLGGALAALAGTSCCRGARAAGPRPGADAADDGRPPATTCPPRAGGRGDRAAVGDRRRRRRARLSDHGLHRRARRRVGRLLVRRRSRARVALVLAALFVPGRRRRPPAARRSTCAARS